jgi:transcriptional regulator with XRE-family HTH domain
MTIPNSTWQPYAFPLLPPISELLYVPETPEYNFEDSFVVPESPLGEPVELQAVQISSSPEGSEIEQPASNEDENISLGDFVRKLRRELGLSQIGLKNRTGVDNRKISLIENHKRGINKELAAVLAPCLKVSVQALLSKTVKSTPLTPFAMRLKKLRQEKKLLQTALSTLTAVDYRTISQVERSSRDLRYHEAQSIAAVLGAKVEELVPQEIILYGKRVADSSKPPLGEHLKLLREERCLEPHRFAKLCKVDIKAIQSYESGKTPKLQTVLKVAAALNLTLEEVCS